jgi:hypothetical protein
MTGLRSSDGLIAFAACGKPASLLLSYSLAVWESKEVWIILRKRAIGDDYSRLPLRLRLKVKVQAACRAGEKVISQKPEIW